MAEFLFGDGLSNRIREVARGRDARCAVAFWGAGAAYEVFGRDFAQRDDVKIICDISMGGTNPLTLRQLGAPENELLKYKDSLHAKTYLSEEGLVVGSANASCNGIGRAVRPAGLIEAGSFFPAGSPEWQEARNWFCQLWKEAGCAEVDQQALERAENLWRSRAKLPVEFQAEAPVGTVLDYDPDRDGLILLSWFVGAYDPLDPDSIAHQGRAYLQVSDEWRVVQEKWLCCFEVTQAGQQMNGNRPHFFFVNGFRQNAGEEGEEPHLAFQRVGAPTPRPPFDFDDQKFHDAFRDVINREDFDMLRDQGQSNPCWLLEDYIQNMQRFWRDVQTQYRFRQGGD